jgi:hypothetical protein
MSTAYVVTWTIDIEADSPIDAARQALAIQRDRNSIATCFSVEHRNIHNTVDLLEDAQALAYAQGWRRAEDVEDADLLVVFHEGHAVHFTGPNAWAKAAAYLPI